EPIPAHTPVPASPALRGDHGTPAEASEADATGERAADLPIGEELLRALKRGAYTAAGNIDEFYSRIGLFPDLYGRQAQLKREEAAKPENAPSPSVTNYSFDEDGI